jgi:hypothetical protein
MPKPFNDKRFQLGEELAVLLADFCAANYGAPAVEVIREAVSEHIAKRLENPEMKERYEAARRRRLKLPKKIIQLASNRSP